MDSKNIRRFVQKRINNKRKKRPVRRYTDAQMFDALTRVGGGQRISENDYTRRRVSTDPTAANFYHRFGSFKMIAEMVFGKSTVKVIDLKEADEEYIVRIINEFGIRTKEEYKEKSQIEPDVFPSEYRILKLFKNYGNLFEASKEWSINQQLILCLKTRQKLGKSPNLEEYAREGINTKLLIRKYITLKNLNRFVRLLEEAYEISGRNKSQTKTDDKEAIERETKKVFKLFSGQLPL